MQAINNYIIFQPIENESKVKSSILLVDEEKPKSTWGKVISVGNLCKVVTQASTILIPRYADEFDWNDERYLTCKEEDVIAIK